MKKAVSTICDMLVALALMILLLLTVPHGLQAAGNVDSPALQPEAAAAVSVEKAGDRFETAMVKNENKTL